MLVALRQTWTSTVPRAARCASSKASPKVSELSSLLDDVADTTQPRASIVPKFATQNNAWRAYQTGAVLKPYDLSYQARQNTQTYRKRSLVAPPSAVCRQRDVFHQLNIDPRTCTTNSVLLSQYVSEMGKVQGRHITGLTSKNQRLLGKTIRRAKQMGIMPTLYRATRN